MKRLSKDDIQEVFFRDVIAEREYQDEKWGNEFDDKNTINDWATYINNYTSHFTAMNATPKEKERALIKIAALTVAAFESAYRNKGFPKRHYDNEQ